MNLFSEDFMDNPDKAWALRTCTADGTSYGGFRWPSEIGSIVTCNDWEPVAECGNGLHGLLDGCGDYNLLSEDADAIWQVVEVDRSACVDIGGKVKFKSCKLVYSGNMAVAVTMISDRQLKIMTTNISVDPATSDNYSQLAAAGDGSQLAASGDGSQLAASGNCSRLAAAGDGSRLASSGYGGQLAASGYNSQLAASGDGSQLAASGNCSRLAASGNCSRLAASGYNSQLATSGHYSQLAASGNCSRLAASGDSGQLAASGDGGQLAASGNYSQLATSGHYSQLAASGNCSRLAASGDSGQLAASGKNSIAVCSGVNGIVSAGENGCIALAWWDEVNYRYRLEVGYVGENEIKPNVNYRLNDLHKFEEVK